MSGSQQSAQDRPSIGDAVLTPRLVGARDRRPDAKAGATRGRRERARGRRGRFILWDALSIIVATLAVRAATPGSIELGATRLVEVAIAIGVWLLVFHAFGLYDSARVAGGAGLRATLTASGVGVLLVCIVGPWGSGPLPRSSLALTAMLVGSLEIAGGSALRSTVRRRQGDGDLMTRTLLVGGNGEARRLAQSMSAHGAGLVPVGALAVGWDGDSIATVPVVGRVEDAEEAIRDHDVDCVFIASTEVSPEEVASIARACRRTDADLRISANVSEIVSWRLSVESNDGIVALAVRPVRLTGAQASLKRVFDVVVGSIALLLALPFFVVIAAAIRLTSPGPAFFRQARVTKDGRVFEMVKFRTMVIDPERALRGRTIDLTAPFFKLENDPRLTRIGRFMRSLSIDELPQLWNVVRGEMSLVGPRPLPVEQVEAHALFLAPRHEVRGGLTGLWQISGRSDLDSEEALRIDRLYIENWSIGMDITILLRTIGAVIRRRGAM